jgi:hypothetical protein
MDAQDILVQLEFEALEKQRRVLGQNLSIAPPNPDENQEGEGISELIISKSHIVVRLRSIQSGVYDGSNAALMIFDVVFEPYTPDKYRFASARFDITFQGQKEVLPYSDTPKVLSFAPESAQGEITEEKRDWKFTTAVSAKMPIALGINASISTSHPTDHRMIIQGTSRPPSAPFRVWWTLNENKLVKGGLPHNCAFACPAMDHSSQPSKARRK